MQFHALDFTALMVLAGCAIAIHRRLKDRGAIAYQSFLLDFTPHLMLIAISVDYIMCYRLIQCIREGLVPDMDVYDAAAWSAPGPLSEISVAKGSMPLKFPDFTRGRWAESRTSIPG